MNQSVSVSDEVSSLIVGTDPSQRPNIEIEELVFFTKGI